jgi:hypothetical protein
MAFSLHPLIHLHGMTIKHRDNFTVTYNFSHLLHLKNNPKHRNGYVRVILRSILRDRLWRSDVNGTGFTTIHPWTLVAATWNLSTIHAPISLIFLLPCNPRLVLQIRFFIWDLQTKMLHKPKCFTSYIRPTCPTKFTPGFIYPNNVRWSVKIVMQFKYILLYPPSISSSLS